VGLFQGRKFLNPLIVELETALAVQFNQVCMFIAKMSGLRLKEKVLYLVHRLGAGNVTANSGWIDMFKMQHKIIRQNPDCAETVGERKTGKLLEELHGHKPQNLYNIGPPSFSYVPSIKILAVGWQKIIGYPAEKSSFGSSRMTQE
jgi:hypothetical protein